MSGKIKIAIPVGDPAGIGPEIALKAALDPAVRAACDPILVCDPALLERHAKACGIKADRIVADRERRRARAVLTARSRTASSVRRRQPGRPAAPRLRSAPPRSRPR